MKIEHGKIQSFLIVAISFWIGLYPLYLQSNNFLEIDLFSPIPAFEILDQEDFFGHEENKVRIFGWHFSYAFSLLSFSFSYLFPFLSSHLLSFDEKISILRC